MQYSIRNIKEASSVDVAADLIRLNLARYVGTVARMLVMLYQRQTHDEQSAEATRYDNDAGFNSADSRILTSFAKQVLRWEATPVGSRKFDVPLSPKQVAVCRKKLPKYARQVAQLVRAEPVVPATV